jgi:hypothetical protein
MEFYKTDSSIGVCTDKKAFEVCIVKTFKFKRRKTVYSIGLIFAFQIGNLVFSLWENI